MLRPRLLGESLFDELMDLEFGRFGDTGKKLYGKHEDRIMKTDVRERDNEYELAVDLPGFKKEQINIDLEKGYLTISATKGRENEEKDDSGRFIRQERFYGTTQRSFYIGENVKEEDVKAKFENGVLTLTFPKEDKKALPDRKTIAIE